MLNKQTYIKDVRLSGYKSIKNISCKLEDGLNIIIGNNGSGKSNLLEFIYKILKRDYSGLDMFDASIEIFDNFILQNEHIDTKFNHDTMWHAEGVISKESNDFENQGIAVVEPEKDKYVYIEFVKFNYPNRIGILSNEYSPKYNYKDKRFLVDSNEENIPLQIAFWLKTLFNLSYLEIIDNIDDLTDDYLYSSLHTFFREYFNDLRMGLQKSTPVEDVRMSKSVRIVRLDSSTLEFRNIVLEYKVNNEWFAWDALSDGTKRLIYTIFTISQIEIKEGGKMNPYKFAPIVLIEEPEIGIHPHQLHLLLDFLKEKSKDQQIIITTHSPQVLDILGPDELNKIIIAEIDYENGTVLRHLNEEEIKKAQFYFKDKGLLSDYWRFSDFQRSSKIK